MSDERIAEKSAILALAGIVLLNEPLLTLFVSSSTAPVLVGVPPLYLYIFGVWGAVILAQYLIVRASPPAPEDGTEATPGNPQQPRPDLAHEETP